MITISKKHKGNVRTKKFLRFNNYREKLILPRFWLSFSKKNRYIS